MFGRRNVLTSGLLLVLAFLLLLALQARCGIPILSQSAAPYFNYQADAFLHGRWDLHVPAGMITDLTVVHGKKYLYYPPFPAVLLMPVVALFGPSASDVFPTLIMSAINLPLLFLLIEQLRANGLTKRPWVESLIISILCYAGSITLWLSLGGGVWFSAHIVCMTFTLLALLLGFRRHYVWSAILLTCAIFSRYTAAAGFPLIVYLAWQDAGRSPPLRRFGQSVWARRPDWGAVPWARLLPVAAVGLGAALLFLGHNALTFGSPLDTGYGALLRQEHAELHGAAYSLSYVPANIVAYFFDFPRVVFAGPFDRHPGLDMLNTGTVYLGFDGGVATSVFATTPLFLFLFWRNRTPSALRLVLWCTLALLLAALLPLNSVGSYQFGARYLYDGYAYAFVLLVLTDLRVDWRFAALGLLGIVINVLGAVQIWTGVIIHI